MLSLLESIVNFISSLIDFVVSFFNSIFTFIGMIPTYISYLGNLLIVVPTYAVVFFTAGISLTVALLIIGRNS